MSDKCLQRVGFSNHFCPGPLAGNLNFVQIPVMTALGGAFGGIFGKQEACAQVSIQNIFGQCSPQLNTEDIQS